MNLEGSDVEMRNDHEALLVKKHAKAGSLEECHLLRTKETGTLPRQISLSPLPKIISTLPSFSGVNASISGCILSYSKRAAGRGLRAGYKSHQERGYLGTTGPRVLQAHSAGFRKPPELHHSAILHSL